MSLTRALSILRLSQNSISFCRPAYFLKAKAEYSSRAESFLSGSNANFLEAQYLEWAKSKGAIDSSWDDFYDSISGPVLKIEDFVDENSPTIVKPPKKDESKDKDAEAEKIKLHLAVQNLIRSYQDQLSPSESFAKISPTILEITLRAKPRSILNLKYGYILRDDTMIQVNFCGLTLNILYTLIYYTYTLEKVKVWAQIGLAGAVSTAIIGYAQMEDPKLIENRLGTIITVFMFYLIASPLFGLKEIIRNKSTEGMPFPIILSGTVVTFMWLLYGIILRNKFLIMQNIVAVVLCASQLSLFVIYPSKPKGKEKTKSKAKKAD